MHSVPENVRVAAQDRSLQLNTGMPDLKTTIHDPPFLAVNRAERTFCSLLLLLLFIVIINIIKKGRCLPPFSPSHTSLYTQRHTQTTLHKMNRRCWRYQIINSCGRCQKPRQAPLPPPTPILNPHLHWYFSNKHNLDLSQKDIFPFWPGFYISKDS